MCSTRTGSGGYTPECAECKDRRDDVDSVMSPTRKNKTVIDDNRLGTLCGKFIFIKQALAALKSELETKIE